MGTTIDLTGKRFGKLVVINRNGKLSKGKYLQQPAWMCLCDCGKTKTVRGRSLRTGHTKSCGCLVSEIYKKCNYKHGLSQTELYQVWRSLKRRCVSGYDKNYNGIKVCEEWKDFINFYIWAKDKYKKGLEIDRINNFKDYSPDNCRFTTHKKNNQNTRRSKKWIIQGKSFESSTDAGKYFKVTASTICNWCLGYSRIRKNKIFKYPPKAKCYAVKKYS